MLVVRGVATIVDLDRLEADPAHPAALTGEIDWAPRWYALPISEGRISLFVPHAAGRAHVYDIAFEAGGCRWRLRGEKRLLARASLHAMTTLYVDLVQEGRPDKVACGILRVPLLEALRFPLTVRAPGRGTRASLRAARRFFRFARRALRASGPAGRPA
jgi:hypothetical protein